jgi:hypothetical protein
MKILKTTVLLLLTTLLFNCSWAQEIALPKKSMTSVDIAALYIPETIIVAAKQMPEEYYTFRPTAEIRSFGELMAHIAESNFEMTAIAKKEIAPVLKVTPNKTEVVKALVASFSYLANARKKYDERAKRKIGQIYGQ